MEKCIICDIDNVYMDSREWNKLMPQGQNREEWDIFQTKVHLCKPNRDIIDLMVSLSEIFPIIFITGREDTPYLREETIKQIEENSKGVIKINKRNKLFMRKPADYREACLIKEEVLAKIKENYLPIMAWDDDKGNVNLYKSHEIQTVHYTKFL